MNYGKLYNSVINNRKNNPVNGYTERHHIVPKSLGGNDSKENLVNLTAREHFICHYLLAKMYEKESFEWYKMNHAFMMMKCSSLNQERYFNSRLYESLREDFSKIASKNQSGKNNSQHGTRWIHNTKLEASKKIPKTEKLPKGWEEGRVVKFDKKIKKRKCKNCGEEVCEKPKICNRHQMKNTFIRYFGFDESVVGTAKFYDEFDRIIHLLENEYNNGKSIEDIRKKYNITSNERLRMMFKSLGIARRSLSEAVKNYSTK